MPHAFSTLSDLNSEYLLANQGKLGFVLLRLAPSTGSFDRSGDAIDTLRRVIADTRGRHPETQIGLTGLPIMENDEMRSSQNSMIYASLVSFVGVALLFVAGFGGVRHALLANVVLIIGTAWAFGYATLSVGHLNILSVTFTVTLVGIGIDYGVYYVARYLQHRREGEECQAALMKTSRGAGPAILTGAMTTAISFFAAGFTNFTGVAELGIIAGGGILLCAVAQLGILPAALLLVDRSSLGKKMPKPLGVHKWIAPAMWFPRLTVGLCLAATVFCAVGLHKLWYDNNLLNMQAVGLESVELERRLLSECNQSVWYALSISDSRDELLQRKAEFLKLPSVERTEEIVSMLPADHEIKRPIIERIQARLANLPERPPIIQVDRPEKLGQVLGGVQMLLERATPDQRAARQLEVMRDALRRMPLADCYAAISRFQQAMAGDLLSRLYMLRSVANPDPPQLTDLPASLVNRFVGTHGRYLLKIYGRGNIWDTESLSKFVQDVRSVDRQVTGNPLQAYEASLEMKQSYQEASLYSFLVIVGVLMFELRSWKYCLLASLPLGIGLLQTFGLLGLLDIPLNPANLIALPLILGIGIDYGIHIVHEFREQHGPYQMSPGTAIAVVVDGLTTIMGFGSLMIASHQGLQSLGRVLTLGITCCMLSSMIFLPGLLRWITRNRPVETPADLRSGERSAMTTPRPAAAPAVVPGRAAA
jgi:hopanoid biosynthesis associated RND transporter like protein HpnN